MSASLHLVDNVLIVSDVSRIDSGNASEIEERVREYLTEDPPSFLLDFSDLSYISSAGLRLVLVIGKHLKTRGRRLAVCDLKDNVREVFEISGFLRMLDTFEDRDSAWRFVSAGSGKAPLF